MNPFTKAIFLLTQSELGEISSDELRTQLRQLKDQMKAALDQEQQQGQQPPQTQY